MQDSSFSKTCGAVCRARLATGPTAQNQRRDFPGHVKDDVHCALIRAKTCEHYTRDRCFDPSFHSSDKGSEGGLHRKLVRRATPIVQNNFAKIKQPPDMYRAFAITRPVQVDLIRRRCSGSANTTHCHSRLRCRAHHQRSQRTRGGVDSAHRITNPHPDNDSHDFVIPLDAS